MYNLQKLWAHYCLVYITAILINHTGCSCCSILRTIGQQLRPFVSESQFSEKQYKKNFFLTFKMIIDLFLSLCLTYKLQKLYIFSTAVPWACGEYKKVPGSKKKKIIYYTLYCKPRKLLYWFILVIHNVIILV